MFRIIGIKVVIQTIKYDVYGTKVRLTGIATKNHNSDITASSITSFSKP